MCVIYLQFCGYKILYFGGCCTHSPLHPYGGNLACKTEYGRCKIINMVKRIALLTRKDRAVLRNERGLIQGKHGSHRPQTPPPVLRAGEVTLSARKVVPCVRLLVLLRTVYSQAQGCMCTALQLGSDVEQPWLMSKHDVIHKTGST